MDIASNSANGKELGGGIRTGALHTLQKVDLIQKVRKVLCASGFFFFCYCCCSVCLLHLNVQNTVSPKLTCFSVNVDEHSERIS